RGHEVIFLALTTARQYLEKYGIPSIGFKDLLFLADENALEFGKKLAMEIPVSSAVSMEETIAYLGMSFSDLIAEKGVEEAEKLYAKQQRQAFLPVRTMKKILEYYKPDVVVATNSPRSERAAIMAARELGIPAVCVVDLFATIEKEWIGAAGFAERICVLNQSVKDMLLGCGRGEDEVVVTGNPAFDVLLTDEACEKGRKMRAGRGWNDGKINILFASQPEPENHPFNDKIGNIHLPDEIENVLRGFVGNNDEYRLIVRYHPSQNCVFKEGKNVELSTQQEAISAVLHAVDLVITITSTVAVEASIIGKPVITVDKSIFTEDVPYVEMGISIGVKETEELAGAILSAKNTINDYDSGFRVKHGINGAGDNVVGVVEGLGIRDDNG
ncbi:MAG: CDP-glycerol glycerophosphotransferase family protein, partial [Rickettsiales bacterium]